MAQQAQTRVQQSIQKLLRDLDQSCLRKMQADMHNCAAKCCEDESASMEKVHECINSCSNKLNTAQNYLEQELTGFQNRLERCVLQCQDDVKDKIGPNTTESEMSSFTNQFEKCVVKCADSHIELIPNMGRKMKEYFNKGKF